MRNFIPVVAGGVGVLLSYTYAVHLIGPYADTCNQGDDSAYLASIILGGGTLLVSSALIAGARRYSEVLRWFTLLHVVTIGFAVTLLPGYLWHVTWLGHHVCFAGGMNGFENLPAPGWHRWYAPLHLGFMGVFAWNIGTLWRRRGA